MKDALVKFRYGEEVICQLEDLGIRVSYKNCATLLPMENQSWHLVTWMPYSNARYGVSINKNDVLFVVGLEKDMQQYYDKWKTALNGQKMNT
jgi:N-acetylneuraminic acid mutarotase